jgi:hypothetical protein
MKKLIFLVIIGFLFSFLISSLAFAELANIQVGKGTLKIGGILQAGFTYYVNPEQDTLVHDSFTLNRARFLFWGDIVPDKVKYFVQLDHSLSTSVLDYKAQFFYVPKTEIAFGRFLPNFTLYMPYSTAKLEMINYPLTTLRFAVWRQVGIQTTTTTDYVDFNVGIFNGYPANNFSDNNDAKDFLLRADFKPPVDQAKIQIGGYAWIGSGAPSPGVSNPDEKTLEMNRFGGFANVDYKATEQVTVKFRGEFLMASTENVLYANIDSVATTDAQAFFAHLGVQPSPRVEFLARYDFHDPNTDVSYEEAKYETESAKGVFANGMSDDDEEAWLTAGVNYYLEGINAMFYLNYIHKMELGYMNKWDADKGEYVKEKREVDNDVVQGQVQITF